jgi:hypothetical protein
MGTETPNPGGRPNESAPGKPGSRQPPDANTGIEKDREEGQEIPKTGRDPSEPVEQDTLDDVPGDDEDEDELGNIELPGEGGAAGQRDDSRPGENP